jgi:hypothetical protein
MTSVFGDYGISRAQLQAIVHPGYVSGNFYPLSPANTSNGTVAAADTLYLHLALVPRAVSIQSLYTRCSGGGTGSNVKYALWRDSVGLPIGLPVAANNTGAATTGTGSISLAVTATLAPGFYWFGSVHNGSPLAAFTTLATTSAAPWAFGAASANTAIGGSGTAQINGYSIAQLYTNDIAALDLTGAGLSAINGAIPLGGMRIA